MNKSMANLLTLSALTLIFSIAGAARAEKVYRLYEEIDFNGDSKLSRNLYDDGIALPEEYDDLQPGLQFNLASGVDFSVSVHGIEGADGSVECRASSPVITPVEGGYSRVTVDLLVKVGVDDGSSCVFSVDLTNGKKVEIEYYAIGT
jgi:hypothetical protein